jgi:hypothetical protein
MIKCEECGVESSFDADFVDPLGDYAFAKCEKCGRTLCYECWGDYFEDAPNMCAACYEAKMTEENRYTCNVCRHLVPGIYGQPDCDAGCMRFSDFEPLELPPNWKPGGEEQKNAH